jgi:U3 small nucleolar RNA-associated protein 14
VVVEKNSGANEKSKNKLKKQARKREEERDKAREDATVEISTSSVLVLADAAEPSSSSVVQGTKASHINTPADDSDVNSEVEEQEKALSLKRKNEKKGLKPFEQRDLVALAFAGDNVVQVCRLPRLGRTVFANSYTWSFHL